ncbi:hypothetical protein NDU88_001512 [Pleurodeles waltl]|uniref:Uncharacterized protein n=1 Tax=Pleurodeles waltl TaxID=8319 RepID=A0AAV7SZU8_PLEWA|nr:hypothetical protein NDU88_001512 [Pleurodeles waltl]
MGRTRMHGRALRGSRYTGGSPAAFRQQSPVGSDDGRVEIQAEGTMALEVKHQSDVAPAITLMTQELRALRESGVEDDMC